MSKQIITFDKKYRTEKGPARIYAIDGGGDFPVHGAIYFKGVWEQIGWTIHGEYNGNTFSTLIEVFDDIEDK